MQPEDPVAVAGARPANPTEGAAGAGSGAPPGGDGGSKAAAVWSIRAHGDIDIDHAPVLAGRFADVLDQGAKVVVLDLSGATFLDSSGIRVIVRAGEQLRAHDGQLLIEGASGAVSRVLEITGLLERYASSDDADLDADLGDPEDGDGTDGDRRR
jgi:anti-anti-sigma factor